MAKLVPVSLAKTCRWRPQMTWSFRCGNLDSLRAAPVCPIPLVQADACERILVIAPDHLCMQQALDICIVLRYWMFGWMWRKCRGALPKELVSGRARSRENQVCKHRWAIRSKTTAESRLKTYPTTICALDKSMKSFPDSTHHLKIACNAWCVCDM